MCNVNNDMCATCRLINFCADTVSAGDINCRNARTLVRRPGELVESVLVWWKNHRYDTTTGGDGKEYNLYNEEPAFVTIAKKLASAKRIGGI